MQTLASLELVPNHTLRRLIQNWCKAHGGGGSSGALVRLLLTPSVAVATDTVARMLREVQSSMDLPPSLKNIMSVAQESERNRKSIQESDAIFVLALVIGGALELRSVRAASDAEFDCNPSLVFVQRKLGCQGKCRNRSCENRIGNGIVAQQQHWSDAGSA
ncbi:unnamed protein product [Sphagnum jensenii]|uniref:U-box domain-containing protein n=1 Tax=Sphagnum jensenii TaxID=128206 RepID=A0ABP1BDW0_9BRYO